MSTETKKPFYQYEGPGLYRVGEHGAEASGLDYKALDSALLAIELDPDYEDNIMDIHFPDGSLLYIEEVSKDNGYESIIENDLENVYSVLAVNVSESPFPLMGAIKGRECDYYSSTDHALFGSGNVRIETKGKLKLK